jgi:hypothetical protein
VAEHEDTNVDDAAEVSDWLVKPFTLAHARTKVRTWLLRAAHQTNKHRAELEEHRRLPFRPFVVTGADRRADKIAEYVRVLEKETHRERSGISSEKAALLWMYGSEMAAFDTPEFGRKLGRIITQATSKAARKAG